MEEEKFKKKFSTFHSYNNGSYGFVLFLFSDE